MCAKNLSYRMNAFYYAQKMPVHIAGANADAHTLGVRIADTLIAIIQRGVEHGKQR